MIKKWGWIGMALLMIGCAGQSHLANNNQVLASDPTNGNDSPNQNEVITPPFNADPNIKSLRLGSTTYDVIHQTSHLNAGSGGEFNRNILVDTFTENPLFTADKIIVLAEGQNQVIFSDEKGDWPPIQVTFY